MKSQQYNLYHANITNSSRIAPFSLTSSILLTFSTQLYLDEYIQILNKKNLMQYIAWPYAYVVYALKHSETML